MFAYKLQQDMPTRHFIHIDSAWWLVCGKFKFYFLELSGIYIPNIVIVKFTDTEDQLYIYLNAES